MTTDTPRKAVFRRVGLVALARFANAVFFLVTATYCVLTYNSFAYQQFIRPRLVSSLASFVVYHHLWHWVLLGVTVLTLLPHLKSGRGRRIAWGYLGVMTALGVVILVRPILPSVENDALGLQLAFAFLIPPIWLAVFDHVSTSPEFRPAAVNERRVVISAVAAAGLVWVVDVIGLPFRFNELGDFTMSWPDLAFGIVTSLVVHVGIFTACTLLMLMLFRPARLFAARGIVEDRFIVAMAAAGCGLITARLVFGGLSFRGPSAWWLAAELGVALTAVWSGVARRLAVSRALQPSAFDVWFSPLSGLTSRRVTMMTLAVLPAVAFLLTERVAAFDWDFLVQNLCVVAVWIVACAWVHALVQVHVSTVRARPMIAGAVMLIVALSGRATIASGLSAGLTREAFVPEFVLDGYAAIGPSYRLLRHLLRIEPSNSAEFFAYLQANTLIERAPIAPIDVDFVKPLSKATRSPHIFLFVIDSLRRDYLSVYNPAVTFTPSFATFAAEGDAFERAFTRYGGTGLSMPSIWAGGMLVHKEYVLPFQPMNALEKLLSTNGYRSLISMDHITEQLLDSEGSIVALDEGRDEMQYDFCATLDELRTKLAAGVGADAPIFAHTRSLNLHVSKLTNRSLAPEQAYSGFQGPAAAAVRRMDRCFGGFIDFLKQGGIYDDSIVIITSDHGDSLGEAKRWGHSYTMFPEIVRIPLLIHVPASLRGRFAVDPETIAFSTDITPTLYALLGYSPRDLGWAYGAPLFSTTGTDQESRRHDTFLVASSYGPVYGLLRDNGRALYIADGVNLRDYAYDLSNLRPIRIGVTDTMRSESRAIIRAQVGALGEMYHFTARH